MSKAIDLVGQRFGRLVAFCRVSNNRQGKSMFKCICDCGKEHIASSANLRRGNVKSCGCIQREMAIKRQGIDLTGQRFSNLLVLSQAESEKSGRYRWHCRCDCGEKCIVSGTSLRLGITKDCGCSPNKNLKDISGQIFGRLTAIEDTGNRKHRSAVWLCKCSCGNFKEIIIGCLTSGSSRSCGCLQKESVISGKEHYLYNHNLTDAERQDRREYKEYAEWRKAIYERDNYTCQKCGNVGGILNAHHIESYNANKKLRTTLENGVTLCGDKCHLDFHHQYGRGNNTREQFNKFMGEEV